MLCLPLFLGLASEDSHASQQASCVPNDLMAYVDSRISTAATDRWVRIKNALTEQPGAMPLSEAQEILANRKANGYGLEHMDEVVVAIECLAQPEPVEIDAAPQACVSPELQADVQGYSGETWQGSVHVERWLRVLQTFSGTANDSTVMTPTEAQTYVDNGWQRWVPVLAALQCLETEALNESVEEDEQVEVEVLEPDPVPLVEETAVPPPTEPQDADITSLRVYFHGGIREGQSSPWTINEDDHWESELIIHFVSNQSSFTLNNSLCVSYEYWSGDNHWNNGPITLPGFDVFAPLDGPGLESHPLFGRWQCTGSVGTHPLITVLNFEDDNDDGQINNDDDGIVEFVYRATVRTRDNNVVEDDFSIADDLEFRYFGVYSGKTKHGPELCDLDAGCNNNVAKGDPKIPPTPSNTEAEAYLDNTELPVIQDDDVAWISLRKKNGAWTVSVYKPIMVTDGTRIVGGEPVFDNINSAHGLTLTMSGVPGNTTSYKQVHLLIPAENGIVLDKDYPLADLKRIENLNGWHPPDGSESFGESCQSTEKARTEMRNNTNIRLPGGFHGKYALSSTKLNTFVRNNTLSSRTGDKKSLEMDLPLDGSDLCN